MECDELVSEKFVQRGIKKFMKEQFSAAEDEFVQAVELNDISAKAWYYLGLCREKENDWEGANLCFKKALNAAKMQDPEDEFVTKNSLLELATIQMRNEQYITAMGYLRKLNQLDFKDNDLRATVHGILGEVYETMNKKEYAMFCYKQSQKFGSKKYRKKLSQMEIDGVRADDPDDKNSPNILKRKADILFNQQKFKEAIDAYQDTLKVNEEKRVMSDLDNADATMKIAYAYINVQDFSKAKKYLVDAKKLYQRTGASDEVKTIDSTLNKINSLTS